MSNITQNFTLHKAERRQAKLRIGVFGPSGSGKTMSALKMAYGLCGSWDKIAIIDTENGSADLYSDLGNYNVLTLTAPFNPESYIDAIIACENSGMEVIIIDSITHEWAGEGGILDEADRLGKTAKNAFSIWGSLTPRHNKFISKILFSSVHIIACGRSKVDYAMNEIEKNGKKVTVPEKIGLKSITREGFDYEMTVSFDLDITHFAVSTKDRTGLFQDKAPAVISEIAGKMLAEWNAGGKENPLIQKREIVKEMQRLGLRTDTKENIATDIALNTQLALEEPNYGAIIATLKDMAPEDIKRPVDDAQNAPGLANSQTGEDMPASSNKVILLRNLLRQKQGIMDDNNAKNYLNFVYDIVVERIEDLKNSQIDKINKELMSQNIKAEPNEAPIQETVKSEDSPAKVTIEEVAPEQISPEKQETEPMTT